jgi:segregation and condensation protein B
MEPRLDKEAALVETVLFLESEPLDEAALARITGLSRDVVEGALELLVEQCAAPSRGVEAIRSGGGWVLSPKVELWDSLKERYGRKNESRLSRAALETLSIVAYSQPITRAEIEAIRGVSADGMIRFLLEKELVKEVGKKEAPGRPVQYGTTKEFLKLFRLGSIADLPRLDELESDRFSLEGGLSARPETAGRDGPYVPEADRPARAIPTEAPPAEAALDAAPAEAAPADDTAAPADAAPAAPTADEGAHG